MIGLNISFVGLEKAVRDLEKFASKAVPFALRNSVNSCAFAARTEWQHEIKRSFVTRNRFTERSILVEKAKGLSVRNVVAYVGSVATYMGTQETGGTVRGRGKHKAIPAPAAAGQAAGSKRTKLVRAAARLGAIKGARGPAGRGSPKQRNLVAILQAKRAGRKHVLLTRKGGGKGLYLVTGGKRQVKTRLLYDLSKRSVKVPASHTLQRTLSITRMKMQTIHYGSIIAELQRHKVFGY